MAEIRAEKARLETRPSKAAGSQSTPAAKTGIPSERMVSWQ